MFTKISVLFMVFGVVDHVPYCLIALYSSYHDVLSDALALQLCRVCVGLADFDPTRLEHVLYGAHVGHRGIYTCLLPSQQQIINSLQLFTQIRKTTAMKITFQNTLHSQHKFTTRDEGALLQVVSVVHLLLLPPLAAHPPCQQTPPGGRAGTKDTLEHHSLGSSKAQGGSQNGVCEWCIHVEFLGGFEGVLCKGEGCEGEGCE